MGDEKHDVVEIEPIIVIVEGDEPKYVNFEAYVV